MLSTTAVGHQSKTPDLQGEKKANWVRSHEVGFGGNWDRKKLRCAGLFLLGVAVFLHWFCRWWFAVCFWFEMIERFEFWSATEDEHSSTLRFFLFIHYPWDELWISSAATNWLYCRVGSFIRTRNELLAMSEAVNFFALQAREC
jgi:hypothetical protein